jgi:glutathione synthase/RimK-type ligase-like ATP-grasp enzyme
MVLIFSIEHDHSTNEVIKWLNYYSIPFIRINTLQEFFNKLSKKDFSFNSQLNIRFEDVSNKISCVWYRKNPTNDIPVIKSDYLLNETINTSLYYEYNVLKSIIINELEKKYWLNHPYKSSPNKINVLKTALKLGFKIPSSLITSDKIELINFKQHHKEIITKPLYEVLKIEDQEGNKYMNRTNIVDESFIEDLDKYFPPSLFQKNINKSFEVRTVFLEGICYSMAIFSQADEKTKVDFRHYNTENPNRVTAFQLPSKIEKLINKLMGM